MAALERPLQRENLQTKVLIVGAGPIGATLALDLAWRGIDAIVVEQRPADHVHSPRANHVSARAMETFRRLGIADAVRAVGLPEDFPTDIVWVTRLAGHELARVRLPAHRDLGKPGYADSNWPTPEPQHKINQMYLEPLLWGQLLRNERIQLLHSTRYDGCSADKNGVTSQITNLETGQTQTLRSEFMVGCDGGASRVRKEIGARFSGDPVLTRVVSVHIRVPDFIERIHNPLGHRYFVVNPEQMGSIVSLNGRDLWSVHIMLPTPESDPAELDRDRAIRALTGFDEDFTYEVFAEESWFGRRLLANRFHKGRIFLCGDACHIWVPNAGYGMNAGIADAENLAWKLAATLDGWGGPKLLDSYQAERQPITNQVSNVAKDLAVKNRSADFRQPPPELEDDSAAGEAARARIGAALYELNLPQLAPIGLNFAYFYDESDVIAYDGETAPPYSLGEYTPSTVPGCRLPHFCLADGSSVYDHFGPGYTLLRLDRELGVESLVAAAAAAAVPLSVLDVTRGQAGDIYQHPLILARSDHHIAWRGQHLPANVNALLEHLRGA